MKGIRHEGECPLLSVKMEEAAWQGVWVASMSCEWPLPTAVEKTRTSVPAI